MLLQKIIEIMNFILCGIVYPNANGVILSMTIISFFQHTDEIFTRPAKQIKKAQLEEKCPQLRGIMQDMIDTHFQNPEKVGVGLAANQIGRNHALFLTYINQARAERENCEPMELTFWANASYIPITEKIISIPEGCFSVEGKLGLDVPRHKKIQMTAIKITVKLDEARQILDFQHEETTKEFKNFIARVMAHECGHINKDGPIFFFDFLPNKEQGLVPMVEKNDPRTKDQNYNAVKMKK
jgi:peptide deformylase